MASAAGTSTASASCCWLEPAGNLQTSLLPTISSSGPEATGGAIDPLTVRPCVDFCLVHCPVCASRAHDEDPGFESVIEKLEAGLAYE